MSSHRSRRSSVALSALGATAVGIVLSPFGTASAIVYPRTTSNGDCSGKYHTQSDYSNQGLFGLRDNAGGDDDDYCYIDYRDSGVPTRRAYIEEDSRIDEWQYRSPDFSGFYDTFQFKVCEERQDDPDVCTSWVDASIK